MDGCSHPHRKWLFPAQDDVTGERFDVVRCTACGLALTWPAPSRDRLDGADPAPRDACAALRLPVLQRLRGLLHDRRAVEVERLTGGPGRVLDVGCGRGDRLQAFRRRGWGVQGVARSEAAAQRARDALLPVHVGSLENAPWRDGAFDAVVLWHVLEHWPEPARGLAAARRLLRPGGVLMVGVPNFASAEARATAGAWFHLDVPRHAAHLSPETLAPLLAASGFEPRRWSYFAPELDLFSFVQSAQNAAGLPRNLLHHLLNGTSASATARSAGAVQLAAALASAAPLGLAAVPITALLSLARQGSSVTAWAVRTA